MGIKGQEEADAWFARLVKHNMSMSAHTKEQAEAIEKSNLGYYAGYGDAEQRRRVEKLFGCEHPVFGSVEENGLPTPEQAFEAGFKYGEAVKRAEQGS
jgi:hypothetical protein